MGLCLAGFLPNRFQIAESRGDINITPRFSRCDIKPGIENLNSSLSFLTMIPPKNMQLIGSELAIAWEDGKESYIDSPKLRANSPSASVSGEKDIFGTQYGGEAGKDHSQVEIESWTPVGSYAFRFRFSDGHNTGIYSYDLLRKLGGY